MLFVYQFNDKLIYGEYNLESGDKEYLISSGYVKIKMLSLPAQCLLKLMVYTIQ